MEKEMVKNIYKSPRRLRAKYTHRTNLAVYALDISPLRGAAGYGVDTPFRHGKHPPDVSMSILRMPESAKAKEEHYKKTCKSSSVRSLVFSEKPQM